jgi:hypothetical protein
MQFFEEDICIFDDNNDCNRLWNDLKIATNKIKREKDKPRIYKAHANLIEARKKFLWDHLFSAKSKKGMPNLSSFQTKDCAVVYNKGSKYFMKDVSHSKLVGINFKQPYEVSVYKYMKKYDLGKYKSKKEKYKKDAQKNRNGRTMEQYEKLFKNDDEKD